MPKISTDPKNTTWVPYGKDALYIYKKIADPPEYADFQSFILDHKDWLQRYSRKNLQVNFQTNSTIVIIFVNCNIEYIYI